MFCIIVTEACYVDVIIVTEACYVDVILSVNDDMGYICLSPLVLYHVTEACYVDVILSFNDDMGNICLQDHGIIRHVFSMTCMIWY